LNVIDFTAEVPVNTWLSIGFGPSMYNVDMILMQAYSTISKSVVTDLWSTTKSTPNPDKIDNLTGKQITENTSRGTQTFKFSRKLDTGDTSQDFLVPVGSAFTMCYAINYKQPQFAYHQDYSTFPFYLAQDGKVMFTLDPVIYDANAVIEST
jgi:hypothetical protein